MQQANFFLGNFLIFKGFSTPVLGQTLSFPVYNCFAAAAGLSYIQIVHCPAFYHWLTIEIKFDEDAQVFDSKYLKLSFEVKKQIASIIKSKNDQISLHLEKTQQQKNNTDCGLYAIAFATDLCYGGDPASLLYEDGTLLRQHFLKCLQEGCLTPFPSKQATKRKPQLQNVNIYCVCRMPYVLEHKNKKNVRDSADDVKMVFCDCCKTWYHFMCLGTDGKELTYFETEQQEERICQNCIVSFDLLSDDGR